MELGVNIPVRHSATGDRIREFCVLAEQLGFTSLWQGDHVVIPERIESPYPYGFRFRPDIADLFPDPGFMEACTTLAFAAGCTERVLLGTGVLVVPMRNPLLLAKQLSTLSVLSGGRAIAGIGVGWMKEEFDALGASFERRGERTDEYADIMQRVWRSERPVAYEGEFYSFEALKFMPRPVDGRVPIWIGGHTERALKRTASYADGWYAVELPPEEFAATRARLLQLWEDAGREGRPVCAVATRLKLTGPDISRTIETVQEYETNGADHLISYATTARPVEENIDRMRRVAEEIMPHLATAVGRPAG